MLLTVASSILLSSDESLRVEKTPVRAASDLIDDIGLEVDVERTGHVLAGGCLREKCAEAIIAGTRRTINQTTIRLERHVRHLTNVETRQRLTLRPCSTVYNSPV